MHITIKTTSKEKSDEALARIFKQISLYRDWLHVECYVDDHTIEFGVQENKHQKELRYYTLFGMTPIPLRNLIEDFRGYIQGKEDNKWRCKVFVALIELVRCGYLHLLFEKFTQEELRIALREFDKLEYNYQKNDFQLLYRCLLEEVETREKKEGFKGIEKEKKIGKINNK